jgi:hypothetical protein
VIGDWTPLFGAFEDSFESTLDVARHVARDYPDEVDAVERVRRFMRLRIRGGIAHVRIDDVMFTFGLVIVAVGRAKELGPGDRSQLR